MAPSTPMTPAVYVMEDSECAANDGGNVGNAGNADHGNHTISFHPQESSPSALPVNTLQQPYPQFGSVSDLNPLTMLNHPAVDYMGYPGLHYIPTHSFPQHKDPEGSFMMSGLAPLIEDGSWAGNNNPCDVYARQPSPSYFLEDYLQPLATTDIPSHVTLLR
ncbi:hypothetical protein BJX76DRAFT_357587 [Aspergillus varians]